MEDPESDHPASRIDIEDEYSQTVAGRRSSRRPDDLEDYLL
jgi:hypothetical protein